METKKIALACFIGGVICGAVALAVAPAIWWLGVIAGFAGGYVSYEFREVRRAVPIALRSAARESSIFWNDGVVGKIRAWLSKPHPFYYPAAAITIPIYLWFVGHVFYRMTIEVLGNQDMFSVLKVLIIGTSGVVLIIGVFEFPCVIAAVIYTLAFIGARVGQKCFWRPFFQDPDNFEHPDVKAGRLIERGYHEKPLTTLNVVKWAVIGVGVIMRFFVWTIWKWMIIKLFELVMFLFRFGWHIFMLIHSEKRLLCGVDGAIGGAVSYLWLSSAGNPIIVVLFGGLLGAAFGVLNWEIVSKRLLKVEAH